MTLPTTPALRLLSEGAAPGAWNMALDEALLRSAQACPQVFTPTLRFYRWAPSCLSLGRHQTLARSPADPLPETLRRFTLFCEREGFDLVRRPTGGRAIFHHRELTYSVVLPRADLDLLASYRLLSEGLRLGLRRLGLEAEFGHARGPELASRENCFAISARADLLVEGAKVVGSAQMRTSRAILQHGSLPLERDWELEARLYGEASPTPPPPALRDLLRRPLSYEELEDALVEGFAEAWDARPVRGTLTEEERAEAERLARRKYATPEWTLRGEAG